MSLKGWLNWQVLQGLVRQGAQALGIALVSNGIISEEQNSLLLGAIMSIAALAWSLVEGKKSDEAKEVVKTVAADPTLRTEVMNTAKTDPTIRERPVINAIKKALGGK